MLWHGTTDLGDALHRRNDTTRNRRAYRSLRAAPTADPGGTVSWLRRPTPFSVTVFTRPATARSGKALDSRSTDGHARSGSLVAPSEPPAAAPVMSEAQPCGSPCAEQRFDRLSPDSPGGSCWFESSSCPSAHINYVVLSHPPTAEQLARVIEQNRSTTAQESQRSNSSPQAMQHGNMPTLTKPSLMPLLQSMASNTGAAGIAGGLTDTIEDVIAASSALRRCNGARASVRRGHRK